jgi:hypothetical protein
LRQQQALKEQSVTSNKPFSSDTASSKACLFTLPFPVYVDTDSVFDIQERRINQCSFRVYPLFRSGPANFVPAPAVNPLGIPLPDGRRGINAPQDAFPLLAGLPAMAMEKSASVILSCGATFENKSLRYFPMDSLRVDVLGEAGSPGDAAKLVHDLLGWLKVETKQWWIGRELPMGGRHYLRSVIPITRSGHFQNRPEGMGGFTTMRGDETPLDSTVWYRVLKRLEQGCEPEDYQFLLLDAKYHSAINEPRRAVIDAAVACEQATERTFVSIVECQWGLTFKHGKYFTKYDLTKHINQDMKKLIGCEFSEADPEANAGIDLLWKCRGDLAHGKHRTIQKDQLKQMIHSAEKCIEWLEHLRAKNWKK